MEVNAELYQYQWIINEGLLRDEGTLFGIAGAGMEEKAEAIRDYYRIKKAVPESKRDRLNKKMEELRLELLEIRSDQESLYSTDDSTNVIPTLIQLLLYTGICYFNFWLERYWLSPIIGSTFICLGLYLFGLFSVFIGRSIMYNNAGLLTDTRRSADKREKWKIYLEELGVPLIVALFIAILPGKAYPLEFSIVAALLFFILFLFAGKGLVNTLIRVREELQVCFHYLRQRKEVKTKARELGGLQKELETTLAMLEELNGEEAYKIKTFASEYQLAFESRRLTDGMSFKKLA
jgi:hypothetical protein